MHIPHACAYPIAGQVREYRPDNYPPDEPLVPHGESVSLTAPAAFRHTFPADPQRHLHAAEVLAPAGVPDVAPRDRLPAVLSELMRDIGTPNGIGAVGFRESDIPELVAGTMKQQRLLATAPRDVDEDAIAGIFRESMRNW